VPEPLVTVAMSVHNAEATLEAALRSILWQTFSDWEMILIDDGSTDQTGRILSQVSDVRIHVVQGEDGQKGLATRLNQCIEFARRKYVARMDADDVAYPERLERQVQYLEAHPDVDLLGHGAVLFKGDGQTLGVYPTACEHEEICRRPWWGFPLAHPTWMGKQSWFVGHPYNERLTKGQDQELLLRSFQTSRFAALPDILLGYRMETISIAKSASGRFAYCRRLLAQVQDLPSALMTLRGISVHGMALARDLVLDLTGTMIQGVRQSFGSADESTKSQWQALWNRLCVEQDRQV
jgi:glycosyltransferase involved in cell wall biosynthesis